ncbi:MULTISPECIES: NAD(P)/FAD-dependent oxidoreductase [Mycobacteriaceae]|jgi:sulfide:quinone oxidoreductase|uniref:NAD(P)/FAD-dependent oxidoreductase n=2 Tax=Mycolicibacter TaxID=1073531 RepID=A0A9X7WDU4_9MYCO|nr:MULTISPECIES: FAD/NAD(P)-binding oxidoreductase [Mycobacteriaceae]KAA1429963.1 NAD(P)/FAD-dependent oxidoreductase [Mycolicibacter arupensis]MBL3748836.1 NAD(P)/FAD-dependent oxidoreductase [Mycobacteroides abscessus subsp. massiliense]MEB3063253.1 FAD/NAD(P)-binding oxidoreductase [Mycolicibacter sp. MYC101]QZA06226.1 NAD(P)/FAD-dependent oxidoreductase [Mycolicibacter heraklionensis]TXI56383.1 MAG: NAD(P)/FAD-dependent oxidoreductase [Mycolicibacter arupensis]
MARVAILGAGIAGHTAAMHLRRMLPRKHEVVVVSPEPDWNFIPSNIWVGVGRMEAKKVLIPLEPIYKRKGIGFHQGFATTIHPAGSPEQPSPSVDFTYTDPVRSGETGSLTYDYLINATGPKLNFAATPGLGPDGHSWSVCTAAHAAETAKAFNQVVAKLKTGQKQRLVIGVGHGTSTCEGAAFEYTFNVEHMLRAAGVRDLAEVIYLTNEYELGDFGVDGMKFVDKGFTQSSRLWTESLFRERGVKAITQAHVSEVMDGKLRYEQLDGTEHDLDFDFAMLLPPFRGAGLSAYDKDGADITSTLFAPSGFLKVDADYSGKPYEEWSADDWPRTYESCAYPNIFAPGIAFAPPHSISQPRKSPNGTVITPSPPRTGMPSGIMAKTVAQTIRDRIARGGQAPAHHASMAAMGAACVASAGAGFRDGSAAAMTMFPVVPDPVKYPQTGRDLAGTYGEIGLAGHWIKALLHHLFIYKAKANPLWWLIPE